MAKHFGRWFRFYDAALDDPKVQRLSDRHFRAWINLLCLANRHGGVIQQSFEDIGFALRMSSGHARDIIQALISAGLVDQQNSGFSPHNWNERQFKADVSTERVKRFRKRRETVSETAPDTDTDTDTEQKERARASAPPPRPIGRIAWTQEVPDQWHVTAAGQLKSLGLEPIETNTLAAKFTAHYRATGETRTISEWQARFIKWAIDEARKPNGSAQRQPGKPERKSASSIFLELGNGTRAAE